MSSKKKGKGKTTKLTKKNIKFINDDAVQRFEIIKVMPLIFERGFKMEKRGCSLPYVLQIHELHWETFCHPRTEVVLPWVFEFYANARSMEEKSHGSGKIY